MKRVIGFFGENKKLTAILFAFLFIGALLSGAYFYLSNNGSLLVIPQKVSVVIDAGHGGKDAGATSGNRKEKDDNLNLALKVAECLEAKGIDCAVTRTLDVYLSLESRCRFANIRSADLFVSLHRNSVSNEANGVEIWIGSENSSDERELAQSILDALEKVGISENRGVKSGYAGEGNDYYVNKNTDMTSCLVELGFISSDLDNELYDEKLNEYAQAIADAIEKQLKKQS
jgi:N-acetylmuramoyl-L-alanine amidase